MMTPYEAKSERLDYKPALLKTLQMISRPEDN